MRLCVCLSLTHTSVFSPSIIVPIRDALIHYNESCRSFSPDMRHFLFFLPFSSPRAHIVPNSSAESGSSTQPPLSANLQTTQKITSFLNNETQLLGAQCYQKHMRPISWIDFDLGYTVNLCPVDEMEKLKGWSLNSCDMIHQLKPMSATHTRWAHSSLPHVREAKRGESIVE